VSLAERANATTGAVTVGFGRRPLAYPPLSLGSGVGIQERLADLKSA